MGAMAKQQRVYLRNYTTGLAIVNPTNISVTVNLEVAYDYTDCYGVTVQPMGYLMSAHSGAVLLRKPKQRWLY